MVIRKIFSSGVRRVRLGEKKKKRFVIFDNHHWHLPDGADVINDFVWCQTVCYFDPDDKNDFGTDYVSIGGVEILDERDY